jgi:radical SAM-linked protein
VYRQASPLPPGGQRADLEAWQAALSASGLPLLGQERPDRRPRILMAAPLPAGSSAEQELLDIYLTRRLTVDRVRDALVPHLPAGRELVGLHDVWLGEPPLPAQVVAAEYQVELGQPAPAADEIQAAASRLLAARALPRERARGSGPVRYDLRPLVDDVRIADPGPPVSLRLRVRFDPGLGTGRPGEVLAALEELLGRPLPVDRTVRLGLILAGET